MNSTDELATPMASLHPLSPTACNASHTTPSSALNDISAISHDSEHHSQNNSIPVDDGSKYSLEVDSSFHLPDAQSSSLIVYDVEKTEFDDRFTATTDEEDKDNIQRMLASTPGKSKTCNGDGSDSGVDIEVTSIVPGSSQILQRALSSTSGGYASSCGGLDEHLLGNGSCNSSMISCCSELGDIRSVNTVLLHNSNQDCTSEGGSESSSITGGPVSNRKAPIRKKVALIEPVNAKTAGKKEENSVARSRSRAASVSRAALQSKVIPADRARSRDKIQPISKTSSTPPTRATPIKRPTKPDSLPSGKEIIMNRMVSARTPSVSRRTPGVTPTVEDGRWPSVSCKANTPTTKPSVRAGSSTPENLIIKTKIGPICLDAKLSSGAADKFATLPRRRKEKSDEDLRSANYRSTSAQRDRMSTSLIKRQLSKETAPSPKSLQISNPVKRTTKPLPKTKIYHETCVQTALTSLDIDNAFAGIVAPVKEVEANEMISRECQVDIRDKEIERLQEQLRQMTFEVSNLQETLTDRSTQLAQTEQQLIRERDEKQAMTKELQSNTERILGMLALVQDQPSAIAEEANCDSLLMLESQIQQSGHALEAKQCEIDTLYSFCKKLQFEMNRSMTVQRSLLDEKNEIEKESTELQDFLQDEKTTLVDALREAELECEKSTETIQKKDVDIERLQEECRHLVRISEQRRHEYLGMQSKYVALESRSKDLIAQQGSAVSGASMALTGLGNRLDQLVEQLISSYNISEQELEDVIYHNEAYTNSGGSSEQVTPDREHAEPLSGGSLSPQRHQSFIVAVISAIRNAASTAKHSVVQPQRASTAATTIDEAGEDSDSTEMLDSETEPCLMMENVLEDVSMPDTHSQNMVSSSGMIMSGSSIQPPTLDGEQPTDEVRTNMDREQESIHNLSQAIYNRQKIEQQTSRIIRNNSTEQSTLSDEFDHEESIAEMPSMASELCCAQPLVDQIIGVDNLVTKLLKVLRIIQMDNDQCIQHLIGDKNQLQLQKEEFLEQLRDREVANGQLKCDLQEVTNQLMQNGSELATSRLELQRHRTEIDRLNVDICELSTLCQNTSKSTVPAADKESILAAIEQWQASRGNSEPELMAHIVAACHEIPILQNQLMRSNPSNNQSYPMLMGNLQDAIVDTKRQYDAIDRALETLNGIQTLVKQCPALASLQRDLEETNFHSASTIPLYTAQLAANRSSDCNANSGNPSNGSTIETTNNGSPGRNQRIDSTA